MAIEYNNLEDKQTQLLEGMQVSQTDIFDNMPLLKDEPTVDKLPPINIPAPKEEKGIPKELQIDISVPEDFTTPAEKLGGTFL
jgi:hypothetical protein